MIVFNCKDTKKQFKNWYEAADWFYKAWKLKDTLICLIIDNSSSYFLDFTAWVNDNYAAYDILSQHSNGLYESLFERYISDLAEDLEDDTYDFCVLFEEIEEEKPQPNPNVKYYRITYSCGCGESEDYIEAESYYVAERAAYECAVEDYHCYEGYHGVRTFEEIAEELFSGDWDNEEEEEPEFDIDYLTKDQFAEAQDAYFEEIENTIYWSVEEVSFEEFLENKGV